MLVTSQGAVFAATGSAVYTAGLISASTFFKLEFGNLVEGHFADGAPRWRCALGMVTQTLILPALFITSWIQHTGMMRAWGRTWAASAGGGADWLFVFVFVAFMLADWAIVEVRMVMGLHHVACIIGHLFGAFLTPEGFPFSFAGAVVLELGSATCNLYCLYPSSTAAMMGYLATVSATHVVALASLAGWYRTIQSRGGRLFAVTLTVALVMLRQREAHKALHHFLGEAPRS